MLLNEARATKVMDRYGLDALIATTSENIAYVSGFGVERLSHLWGGRREIYALHPRKGEAVPALIIPATSLHVAAQDTALGSLSVHDIRCYGEERVFCSDRDELTVEQSTFNRLLRQSRRVRAPIEGLIEAIEDRGLACSRMGIDELHITPDRMSQLRGTLSQRPVC